MLQFTGELFNLRGSVYSTDFIDIIIIALLLYSIFMLLKKTRSYMVFLGLVFTTAFYLVAKTFNLYLTELALRYFVSVAVLIFVIIFQNEIRRYFELIGLIGTRQIRVGKLAAKSPTTVEIIQACVKMSQEKLGALIVLEGKDPLESFIDGGVYLDGVISEEILLSIFDDHSEGHDGALIISNNRIAKFGTHLPLSTNFKEVGKHGTRHSAALGLSEVTDALCIVVSEEKGTISVCKEGKMKSLSQYQELEKEIEKYIKVTFDPHKHTFLGQIFKHNIGLKLGALGFAVLVWFFTAYRAGIVEKTYELPVVLDTLPKDTFIETYSPKDIFVTVSGRGDAAFKDINPEELEIELQTDKLSTGLNKIEISSKEIDIPSNLTVVSIEPQTVLLDAQKYYMVQVPVAPKLSGTPSEGFELKEVVVTPEKVNVWVKQNEQAPVEIATETIDITNKDQQLIVPVKLLIPEDIRIITGEQNVNVALKIEPTNPESTQSVQ